MSSFAAGFAPSAKRMGSWVGRLLQRPSSDRINRLYADVAADVRAREARIRLLTPGSNPWLADLNAVYAAAGEGDRSVAERWALLALAHRAAVPLLSPAELDTERLTLLEEAKEKLGGWRQKTVLELLEQWPKDSLEDNQACVRQAMQMRDEAAANTYRKHDLLGAKLTQFGLVLIAVLGALVPLLLLFPPSLTQELALGKPRIWIFAFLFGALGGTLSAIQRTSGRDARQRVPRLLEQGIVATVLPLSGAAAALAAYPLAAAGLLPSSIDSVGAFFAVALAAGTSERLVVRAVQKLDAN
jgi:hypothetical protein